MSMLAAQLSPHGAHGRPVRWGCFSSDYLIFFGLPLCFWLIVTLRIPHMSAGSQSDQPNNSLTLLAPLVCRLALPPPVREVIEFSCSVPAGGRFQFPPEALLYPPPHRAGLVGFQLGNIRASKWFGDHRSEILVTHCFCPHHLAKP